MTRRRLVFGIAASALLAGLLAHSGRPFVSAQQPDVSSSYVATFRSAGRVDATGAAQFRYDRGTGQWGFGASTGSWSPGWRVHAAEFNADGRTDFFLYNPETGQWFRAVNDGAGGFTYFSGRWDPEWDATILDLNGDDMSDVFVYNRTRGRWVRAVYTTASADFSYVSGTWLPGWSLAPAEWNRDGKDDLFLYNPTDGQWVRATNDGVADFTYVSGRWTIDWTFGVSDFDGDRITDVFLYNEVTGIWFIARALSLDGDFAYATSTWSPGWSAKVADFSADSRADVFLYNVQTGEWVQAINNDAGAGGFTYFSGRWDAAWVANVYDFSGDARADVLLYSASRGVYVLCTNDGSGGFIYSGGTWGTGLDIIVPQVPLPAPPPPPPPPPPPNTAPRIVSLASSAARAEPGAVLTITATVEDAETPVDQLTYEWAAETGEVSSRGSQATWRVGSIPSRSGPAVTLTVVERYASLNADGTIGFREHRVSSSVRVAAGELSDLALSFLLDFADSTVSPETCVRNFSDNCPGKLEELEDIRNNRATFLILSSRISVARVTVDAARLNADISAPCEFTSRIRATGQLEIARGECFLRAVNEGRWRLCVSNFFGTTTTGRRFMF